MTSGRRLKIIVSGRLTRRTRTRSSFCVTGSARMKPESWKNNQPGPKTDPGPLTNPLMKTLPRLTLPALGLLLALSLSDSFAQEIPKTDQRLTEIRHLDLTYDFAGYPGKEAWLDRAARLKKKILSAPGRWPIPRKPRLRARSS